MSAFRKLTGDLLAERNFGLRGGLRGDVAHERRGFCESGAADWLVVGIGYPVFFPPQIRNGLKIYGEKGWKEKSANISIIRDKINVLMVML